MSQKVADILLRTKAVMIRPQEPFRFSSGILSPIYCDHRLLLSYPQERAVLVSLLSNLAQSMGAKQIAGVATAGIPWGAWMAQNNDVPFIFVRSTAKSHGTGQLIEGKKNTTLPVIVVEDLISSGASSLSAAQALKNEGYDVVGIASIFTYQLKQASDDFLQNSMDVRSLITLDQLLEIGIQENFFTRDQAQQVLSWRQDPKNWVPSV